MMAITVTVAGGLVIVVLGAVLVILEIAAVGILRMSSANAPAIAANFVAMSIAVGQLLTMISIRRRAWAGDPVHEWLRATVVAFRCMGGTQLRGANLTAACFEGTGLEGVDLRGAILHRTAFRGAQGLEWTRFDPGSLRLLPVLRLLASGRLLPKAAAGETTARATVMPPELAGTSLHGLDLRGALLAGVDLRGADLGDSLLAEADLSGADLSQAVLTGACLAGTRLDQARLTGARIDAHTYAESQWTPTMLAELHERGVEVIGLESFPLAAQDVIVGLRDGLVLSFERPLSHFKQHLIEGSLYAIVGLETECRIAEYRERDDFTSFVRIVGPRRDELERVAEAFYRRVWEMQRQSARTQLARMGDVLTEQLRQRLNLLIEGLDSIELRVLDPPLPSSGSVAAPASSGPLAHAGPGHPLVPSAISSTAAARTAWKWNYRDNRIIGLCARHVVLLHTSADHDLQLVTELCKHLEGLPQGLMDLFHEPEAGDVIEDTFRAELAKADVALALLSADALADAAFQAHVQWALSIAAARPLERGLRVIPLLGRACLWKDSLLGELPPCRAMRSRSCSGPPMKWNGTRSGSTSSAS